MLEVRNPQGLTEKIISCPKCRVGLKVVFPKQEPQPAQPVPPPRPAQPAQPVRPAQPVQPAQPVRPANPFNSGIGGGTVLPGMNKAHSCGKLVCNGVEYPLELGINTVGRKADSSKASVQIRTNDKTMSRMHSVIEVSILYDGTVKTVLRNSENLNPTYVGGKLLAKPDRVILNNGDIIKMGKVKIAFLAGD